MGHPLAGSMAITSLLPPSQFSLLGPEVSVFPWLAWGQLRTPGLTQAGSQEAGVPCLHRGLCGESSPQERGGDRSPLPQEEHWLPAPGTSQEVVLEAVCGACGGGGEGSLQRGLAQRGPSGTARMGGLSVIGGRPLGRRPGEPWHDGPLSQHIALCTNHLLSSFLFCPPPPPPPCLNSSQTTPAFRLREEGPTGGREAPGLVWERSQGRGGEGGGLTAGPSPAPHAGASG